MARRRGQKVGPYNYGPFPEREIVQAYADGGSIPVVAQRFNLNQSRIRTILLAANVLRTRQEGRSLLDWSKVHPKGRKRAPFSKEWRENLSRARKAYFETYHATGEGIRLKDGYQYYSRGPHHGRAVHIVIMEQKLGRNLRRGEEPHHKDRNRANNSPDNLELMPSKSAHTKHHALENVIHRQRDKKGRFQ